MHSCGGEEAPAREMGSRDCRRIGTRTVECAPSHALHATTATTNHQHDTEHISSAEPHGTRSNKRLCISDTEEMHQRRRSRHTFLGISGVRRYNDIYIPAEYCDDTTEDHKTRARNRWGEGVDAARSRRATSTCSSESR